MKCNLNPSDFVTVADITSIISLLYSHSQEGFCVISPCTKSKGNIIRLIRLTPSFNHRLCVTHWIHFVNKKNIGTYIGIQKIYFRVISFFCLDCFSDIVLAFHWKFDI